MSLEEIQQVYDYSKSKGEICKKLNIRTNQNGFNIDKDILKYFSQIGINSREQLSKKNLSNHWLEIQKRDYELNPKYCEYCGKKLPFEKRFAKCCNQSCGSALGNKKKGPRSEEEKLKISESLRKYNKLIGNCNIVERIELIKKYYNNDVTFNEIQLLHPEIIKCCKECGKQFIPHLRKNSERISDNKFCSKECHDKNVSNNAKELRRKEIEAGTFQGWTTRNILSYPENFWIKVLKNNNIEYIPNKPIKQENNIYNYFLDFYIEHNGRKIDLEIDGKQHKYKDRKEHDKIRDEYVKSKGIEVYRIPWNEINSENGKQLMKEKINKFLEFYNMQASY